VQNFILRGILYVQKFILKGIWYVWNFVLKVRDQVGGTLSSLWSWRQQAPLKRDQFLLDCTAQDSITHLRIILKCILKRQNMTLLTGLTWFTIGSNDEVFWTFEFHKICLICWPAERLLAYKENLRSLKVSTQHINVDLKRGKSVTESVLCPCLQCQLVSVNWTTVFSSPCCSIPHVGLISC
jgi:hypothetical protein